jgi:AGZA family xanthine/uracil permease-like MFS transporter
MGGKHQARLQEETPLDAVLAPIARYFKFAERGTNIITETRAGLTTFMVMAYIIFLNGSIIAKPLGLDPIAVAAGTCLCAGVLTIAMGLVSNYPFALAAGLGINAIVAYTLAAPKANGGLGMSPAAAMGVIVVEGVIITVLVIVGLREAIMRAVPLALKRSIGVGIGLFILFIGLSNGGLIGGSASSYGSVPPVGLRPIVELSQWIFLVGLLITFVLYAMRIKAALIISIVVTSFLAFVTGITSAPAQWTVTPSWNGLFYGASDLNGTFTQVALITAILTIFAIMLSDFFDTMGTVTGIAAEAGLAEPDGSVPGIGRVLLVDSIAAAVGGFVGVSSNTTYIESAAGVAEGGRTGFTAVVTGVLFLVAILLSPLAGLVAGVATAPALVLVGYLMFTLVKDIDVADIEDGLPALMTMIVMPLTYSITNGIGAGFITWALIKLVKGKWREIHWLMAVVTIAFVVYFAQWWILVVWH